MPRNTKNSKLGGLATLVGKRITSISLSRAPSSPTTSTSKIYSYSSFHCLFKLSIILFNTKNPILKLY